MKKIWEKNSTQATTSLVDSYCFKEGVEYDNQLILHDVLGSIAHVHMLKSVGLLTTKEKKELIGGLQAIIDLKTKNEFVVTQVDEDVHTKVEVYLTENCGEAAKKIHTGRSRNDQIAVDLRLYAKKEIVGIATNAIHTIQCLLDYAKKHEYIPMPGYTHMQKAMPSSIGLWIGSIAESLIDDIKLLETAYALNDQSPLGSGAAFGVSLPIARELTAKLLGFSSVLNNSLYCQAARPKIQLGVMQACTQIMITASKFASDLLLFTTSEFNFFSVGGTMNTGSSIMPQKKNLDVMEYVRAKTYTVISYEQMVAGISAGLPSGYNADFGQTKKPFMDTIEIVNQTMAVLQAIISQLVPNIEVLKKACTKELFAAHATYELVQKGTPFRTAYKYIGDHLDDLKNYDALEVIQMTNHIGGPGNLGLDIKNTELKKLKKEWEKKDDDFKNVVNKLLEHIYE